MDERRRRMLMEVIPSTEPASFADFIRFLGGDAPEQGQKRDWWELFRDLEQLESDGLVEIERTSRSRIESLMLTEPGAALLRELRA